MTSRLASQITEAVAALAAIEARFALIGGLALASHKVVRATQDVDLLVEPEKAEAIEAKLVTLGYRRLHGSADAANYVRGDERLDLLYASRPIARRLLEGARELHTSLGTLRVVSAEGLAAEAPLCAGGGLRTPAGDLYDPYEALDQLMVVVEALCPQWPERPAFPPHARFLL